MRREMIRHVCFASAMLALHSSAMAAREVTDLDQGWRCIEQDVEREQPVDFDDAAWQTIALPHTWNAEDATGGSHDYYRGPGWYRRHVSLDARTLQERQLYLWFGAAGSSAEVFVNGTSAGKHRGAFG